MGVFPGMNLNSAAGYPTTEVHARSNNVHGEVLSKAVPAGMTRASRELADMVRARDGEWYMTLGIGQEEVGI